MVREKRREVSETQQREQAERLALRQQELMHHKRDSITERDSDFDLQITGVGGGGGGMPFRKGAAGVALQGRGCHALWGGQRGGWEGGSLLFLRLRLQKHHRWRVRGGVGGGGEGEREREREPEGG